MTNTAGVPGCGSRLRCGRTGCRIIAITWSILLCVCFGWPMINDTGYYHPMVGRSGASGLRCIGRHCSVVNSCGLPGNALDRLSSTGGFLRPGGTCTRIGATSWSRILGMSITLLCHLFTSINPAFLCPTATRAAGTAGRGRSTAAAGAAAPGRTGTARALPPHLPRPAVLTLRVSSQAKPAMGGMHL